MTLTDWRGTPIKAGSKIVYPVRFGSVMTVVEAKVIKLIETSGFGNRRVTSLRIRPTRESSYGRTTEREAKELTIERVDRVTVVK